MTVKRNRVIKRVSDTLKVSFFTVNRCFKHVSNDIDQFKLFATDEVELFAKGVSLRDWRVMDGLNPSVPYTEIHEEIIYSSSPLIEGLDYKRSTGACTKRIKPAFFEIDKPIFVIKRTSTRMKRCGEIPEIVYSVHLFTPGKHIPTNPTYYDSKRSFSFHIEYWDRVGRHGRESL